MDRPRLGLLVLATAFVVGIIVTMVRPWERAPEEPESPYDLTAQMMAIMEKDDGRCAAIVNGSVVPLAQVRAYEVALRAGHYPSESGKLPWATAADYLEQLIDNELLYQEAQRRGLAMTDDQLRTTVERMKTAADEEVAVARRGPSPVPSALRAIVRSYGRATVGSNPALLESLRRAYAIGKLRVELAHNGGSPMPDFTESEVAAQVLLDQLRAEATIEVLIRP